MINNAKNLNKTNNMEEINKLRRQLEQMYLMEVTNCAFVSDKTVQYSQELDVYIVEEQKRLFNEHKLRKQRI